MCGQDQYQKQNKTYKSSELIRGDGVADLMAQGSVRVTSLIVSDFSFRRKLTSYGHIPHFSGHSLIARTNFTDCLKADICSFPMHIHIATTRGQPYTRVNS